MSSPRPFSIKHDELEEEESLKFKESSSSKNPDGLEEIAPKNPSSIQEDKPEEKEDVNADEKNAETSSVSSTESEKPRLGQSEVADDDEGFRTPTSLDSKIPVITQCPPAPKKTRPDPSTTLKRKVSSTVRRSLCFDLPADVVESMSPPAAVQDEGDTNSKIKKARTDHDSEE